eukprot:TRINITY_DN11224_c0_g1_i3.p1 TRINITY_DN11224_c0_g1~~TRINITY_DN11224_c0_g1_i3.p1  ORF type:complete len:572 (+),score=75.70 TRINITY_DN11224_c0_g1_i3:2-1717(+)
MRLGHPTLIFGTLLAYFKGSSGCQVLIINQTTSVGVGDIINVNISTCSSQPMLVKIQPYLDHTLWGSPTTLNTTSGACFNSTLLVPAPVDLGQHALTIAVLNGTLPTPFRVGLPMMQNITCAAVDAQPVEITNTTYRLRNNSSPLIGMEYEPWFTPHNFHWALAEGAPMVGYYSSFNERVSRLHAYWHWWAGVDYMLVDWTNNLWGKSSWAARGVQAQEIINATTFMFEVYSQMRSEGWPTPNIALLPALDNGASEPLAALQEELDWITSNYLRNFADLLQPFEGKPLLVLFDGGGKYNPQQQPIYASQWSVRWMASQLQTNTALVARHYWSWMDGSIAPIATASACSTPPCANESITITPAFFAGGGWLQPTARGKRQGATFLQQARVAELSKAQNVLINQWNEFAGQPNGADAYADIYNTSLGNDMEPLSLTECGYPRPNTTCGGWGYRYLNFLRGAVMRISSQDTASSIFTVASPRYGATVARQMQVEYEVLGPQPDEVVVSCRGMVVGRSQQSPVDVDLQAAPGLSCVLTIMAMNITTRYAGRVDGLDSDSMDQNSLIKLHVHFADG